MIKVSDRADEIRQVLDKNSMVTVDVGQHLRVVEGVSVTIRCSATGYPRPRVHWELNRKRIRDKLIIPTADTLIIIKFQKRHSGYYTCIARNVRGEATAYSNVHENLGENAYLLEC